MKRQTAANISEILIFLVIIATCFVCYLLLGEYGFLLFAPLAIVEVVLDRIIWGKIKYKFPSETPSPEPKHMAEILRYFLDVDTLVVVPNVSSAVNHFGSNYRLENITEHEGIVRCIHAGHAITFCNQDNSTIITTGYNSIMFINCNKDCAVKQNLVHGLCPIIELEIE